MNTVVTSKEEILKKSRELIREKGIRHMNIRAVASFCGVSVGSVYNYFDSKAELLGAVIESVWQDIFHFPEGEDMFYDTLACISWIYERMEYGSKLYPDFFTYHSVGFLQDEIAGGKKLMQKTWQHILDSLESVLCRDKKIRKDAFDEKFTSEKFADMLFSLMIAAMTRRDYDPSPLLTMVTRSLY